MPLEVASFGTVRALALLALLHDPNPPRLICVEEIDHGLHPLALDRVVDRMRSAVSRSQLIVATHSPALVNRLEAEELIVCERDPSDGASLIPAIQSSVVKEMEVTSELGLGELWFSGALSRRGLDNGECRVLIFGEGFNDAQAIGHIFKALKPGSPAVKTQKRPLSFRETLKMQKGVKTATLLLR